MGEPFPGPPPSPRPPEDRLDSWKEIAAYVGRDVTTVQRWEKREGMPVHRHLHDKIGSVYALRTELDTWARGRSMRGREREGNVPSPAIPAAPGSTWKGKHPARRRLAWLLGVAVVALAAGAGLWLGSTRQTWRNPIADARYQTITDFDGVEQAAAVSRDGHFVAFLSDRDGRMDVWVTQVGTGQFHNLTRGSASELVNPSVRTLGFSPDGSLVTFWVRRPDGSSRGGIGVWAVPTLGGQPRPYFEGAAEIDWSREGSRLVYHTPEAGDPLLVTDGVGRSGGRPIFSAPAGLHCHFPTWAPDGSFIYFLQGSPTDRMDIWRIAPAGGTPERITSHTGHVSHPVLLDRRTLVYLAADTDGSGPRLFGMDVQRRVPHRLSSGLERYTSLSASADGRRLVATQARVKRTLWRAPITDSLADVAPAPVATTARSAFSPRLGPGYLLYVSANGASEGVWKLAQGTTTELWSAPGAHLLGGPAISRDGRHVAFSVHQTGQTLLYAMGADGTDARIVAASLALRGAPAWQPDGQAITVAAEDHGVPRLMHVPIDGSSPHVLVQEYSVDPAWTPDGRLVLFSGPDVGTTSAVKAATAEGAEHPLPALTLTRGGRHLAFLAGGRRLVLLRGEMRHKDLWLVDLDTRGERQLTRLPPDFDVGDFDVAPDGTDVVFERLQERSDVVLLELPRR